MTERNSHKPEGDLASATASQVARWDQRLGEIEAQQNGLQTERANILEKKQAALKLLELVDSPIDAKPTVIEPAAPPDGAQRKRARDPVAGITAKSSWISAVNLHVYAAPLGLTMAELRDEIENGPLAKKFRASSKGYYHALTRLAQRQELVRHNGRVFSPNAYKEYQRKVRAGELADETPPHHNAYSPMGEAILDIVAANPGIAGKQIIQELRTDPEFNATLTPHQTGAFNIIARLVRRKQIARFDDGTCHPGPKMEKRDPRSAWLRRSPLMGQSASKQGGLS